MTSKLRILIRALVVISRDMFIGLLLGISAAVIFADISPGTGQVVGLLIPAGAAAGIFKGLAKFISLNVASTLPSKGYRSEYPKFKLLLLWLAVLVLVLIFAYGLNLVKWFMGPVGLLTEIHLFNDIPRGAWIVALTLISVIGLTAHFYEPPCNEEECLSVEPEELSPKEQS